MITMTPFIAEPHGPRLWVETVPAYVRAWKQRPSVITLGGMDLDNSTGVSASQTHPAERRLR